METRPGALLEPQGEAILLALLANTRRVVVLAPDGKRHLMYGAGEPCAAPQAEAPQAIPAAA